DPLFAEIVIEEEPVGEEAVVKIFRVEVKVVVPVVGVRVQVVDAGQPERETFADCGGPDTVTVALVVFPCSTVPEVGLTETEKFWEAAKISFSSTAAASFAVNEGK